MITKNCKKCNIEFTYSPVLGYPDKRLYCDNCKPINDAAYAASLNQPFPAVPVPVNPPVVKIPSISNEIEKENGKFQSTVWNHTVDDNVYEWGIMPKAGCPYWKHNVKYETIEQLNKLIEERKAIKFDSIGFGYKDQQFIEQLKE